MQANIVAHPFTLSYTKYPWDEEGILTRGR